ncbi:MAG: hypothetical protein U0797_30340 [Gemmataceae bacterium]
MPWTSVYGGLGTDPAEFRRYVVPALPNGEREFDLMTVAPGTDVGGRPRKGEETGIAMSPVSGEMSDPKAKRLRAILRAPEVIQDLYREGLVTQAVAALRRVRQPRGQRHRQGQLAGPPGEVQQLLAQPARHARADPDAQPAGGHQQVAQAQRQRGVGRLDRHDGRDQLADGAEAVGVCAGRAATTGRPPWPAGGGARTTTASGVPAGQPRSRARRCRRPGADDGGQRRARRPGRRPRRA